MASPEVGSCQYPLQEYFSASAHLHAVSAFNHLFATVCVRYSMWSISERLVAKGQQGKPQTWGNHKSKNWDPKDVIYSIYACASIDSILLHSERMTLHKLNLKWWQWYSGRAGEKLRALATHSSSCHTNEAVITIVWETAIGLTTFIAYHTGRSPRDKSVVCVVL